MWVDSLIYKWYSYWELVERIVDNKGQIIMARTKILLTTAGIVILGTLTIIFGDILLEGDNYDKEAEYQIMAINLLDKFIDQVALKSFDEASVSGRPIGIPGSFTSPSNLGPEADEIYPNFDDIDDYLNLSFTDTTSNGMGYTIKVELGYVTFDDTENFSSTQSNMKRMNVSIISTSIPDEMHLSRIFSYYRK